MESGSIVCLMDLPVEMIDKILSYLSYDQIAKLRCISRLFNNICSDKLNKGFLQVEQFHNKCLKAVKTKLPRRESERKHHPLARHSDILMAVETRLSMLSMTFTKYIEARHCCFIPGKVLDEAFKVLRIVNSSSKLSTSTTQYPTLPRPHDFLQEYRDISSMAMEHFDDKILPSIRDKMRLENPRMYCYKNGAGKAFMLGVQSVKMPPQSRNSGRPVLMGSSRSFPSATDATAVDNKSSTSEAMFSFQASTLYKVLRDTRTKCNGTRKAVVTLHRNIKSVSKKLKIENILLKRKLNQHKTIIKHMRRELTDTRNAIRVMSKDLNRLKIEQSSSRDPPSTDRSECNNPSVSMTSSPVKDEFSSSNFKELKRKRDSSEERANKR